MSAKDARIRGRDPKADGWTASLIGGPDRLRDGLKLEHAPTGIVVLVPVGDTRATIQALRTLPMLTKLPKGPGRGRLVTRGDVEAVVWRMLDADQDPTEDAVAGELGYQGAAELSRVMRDLQGNGRDRWRRFVADVREYREAVLRGWEMADGEITAD